MRIHGQAGLAVCLLCAALQAQAAAVIRSVRVAPADADIRITFDASAELHYKLITLHHPDRLVLQLDPVRSTRALGALRRALETPDQLIRKVRIGQYTPDAVRVVLELRHPVRPVATRGAASRDGHRLILDLYPAGGKEARQAARRKDPLGALIAEEEAQLKAAEAHQERSPKPVLATRQERPEKPVPAARQERPAHERPAASLRHRHPFIVAIDAGHGGQDPGAHGLHGTYEKQVTLAIARKLKARLDALPGLHGVLVRDGDYFIPLHQRIVRAQRLHADLFISIHADSDTSHTAEGSSVYTLSERGATSVAARLLAKQENDADRIAGIPLPTKDPYLARTLLDLSQTATINDSLHLGRFVLQQLGSFKPLHNQRVEQAGFAVLKSPQMPSILIETDFINNPLEERKLTDNGFQEHLARAIAAGVRQYVDQVAARRHPLTVAGNDQVARPRRVRAAD
jgi:N-acetylmuramoyl-L-alanine amidase